MAEQLKLENQVCFPVYSLAREIVNRYRPFLNKLDITYPQYLVLLVLWEYGDQTVSQIGDRLRLDSGTLTPLLKRMEQKKILGRKRRSNDERVVEISLTKEGMALQQRAAIIPQQLSDSMPITTEELAVLKKLTEYVCQVLQKT